MHKRSDLQCIRGVAILAVLAYHFFPDYFKNGYVGVDQFFILSGFLMAENLSKHSLITLDVLKTFYYRRFKRILPLYSLCTLLTIISLLYMFTKSTFNFNYPYVTRALFFLTNIKWEDELLNYQQQVEKATNLFTHTWSLSVEIQFYLLAPFLILFPVTFLRKYVLLFAGSLSYFMFTYYLSNRDFQSFAFNSLLTRLWQFILGIVCSQCEFSNKTSTCEEAEDLLPKTFKTPGNSDSKVMSIMLLLSTLIVTFSPIPISSHIVRAVVCLHTAGLIFTGDKFPNHVLSNRFLVYIGDISYALYLVHWPVVAFVRDNYTSNKTTALAILFSIFLSILLTEVYERWYLSLSIGPVFMLIGLLYASCGYILYLNQIPEISQIGGFRFMVPVNLTLGQAMEWNDNSTRIDIRTLRLRECNYTPLGNGETQIYAPNIARAFIHIPDCQTAASEMFMYARTGCEVLEETTAYSSCKGKTALYLERLRFISPDILIITTRHIESMNVSPDPNTDDILAEEIRNLAEIEKIVKEKVFILDAIPRPINFLTKVLNYDIMSGTLNQQKLINITANYQLARNRMHLLAAQCKKCELFDILPAFTKNGTFQIYDEDTKLQYFTTGLHLSDFGLNEISPVLTNVCERLQL